MFGGLTSVGRLPGCHPFLWIDPRCLVRSSGSIRVDSTPSSGAITLSASVSLGYRSGPHWSSHFCGVDASLRIDRGHVRGLASVGQVARLRRSSDRSTMMTPVPLNHRFRTPIFSIRSVLVISLLRALIVTIIGLPATSVRPGRTVASVRAAHSLGEPFSRNPSSIPSPPVLANLPCF